MFLLEDYSQFIWQIAIVSQTFDDLGDLDDLGALAAYYALVCIMYGDCKRNGAKNLGRLGTFHPFSPQKKWGVGEMSDYETMVQARLDFVRPDL